MIDQLNAQAAAAGSRAVEWKTIPQGAATSVWAGVVAPVEEVAGRYCEDCHVAELVEDASQSAPASAVLRPRPANAQALWALSEKMVGETF
jgi:hypothetical protein